MVPFIFYVHRDGETGSSLVTPLDEIGTLPKMMASGSLGDISTDKSIEKALY
ncbi:MAG: hypothetical protein FWH01_01715 [Oscillospiraceae bacterium]|nr:hypothetical protein [Oscillospiraceae bacterium]